MEQMARFVPMETGIPLMTVDEANESRRRGQALIDAALDAGGEDNITALLRQYEIPRDRT